MAGHANNAMDTLFNLETTFVDKPLSPKGLPSVVTPEVALLLKQDIPSADMNNASVADAEVSATAEWADSQGIGSSLQNEVYKAIETYKVKIRHL